MNEITTETTHIAFADYELPVSTKVASELLGLTTTQLTSMRSAKKGPSYFAIPTGKKRDVILYRPSDLRFWMENQKVDLQVNTTNTETVEETKETEEVPVSMDDFFAE